MDNTWGRVKVDAEVLARPTEKEPHFGLAAPEIVKDRNHHPGILTTVFIPFQVADPLLAPPGIRLRPLARADLRGAVGGQTELAADGRVGAVKQGLQFVEFLSEVELARTCGREPVQAAERL